MSVYLGDYAEDETVHFMWNTNAVAGESITRATNGTISVYKDDGDTQTTTGVTDTEDVDGLTGVHRCVVATTDAFYTAGSDYMVVLSAATIDGKAVNAVLAHFSIENRAAAGSAPTAAEVADAVWDEDATAHQTQGTFGQAIGDPGATATSIWSRVTLALPDTLAGDPLGLPILDGLGSLNVVVTSMTLGVQAAIASAMFSVDTGETYAAAVAGSVVKEIVDNTPGGTGATTDDIADAVWDEILAGHVAAGSSGERLGRLPNANAGAAGGLWILGANAAAATTLTGSAGNPALSLTGGSSSHGLLATGTGTGAGMRLVAGSAGNALAAVGGVSSATGAIYVTSAGGGGIEVTSTEGAALTLTTTVGGAPTVRVTSADGNAMYLEGGGNSAALSVVGGTGGALGHAVVLQRGHVNADEISLANSDAPTLAAAFFTNNSGQTYATSVAGSVVKEIADNVTASVDVDEAAIATAVLETLVPGSFASGSVGHTIGMLSGVTVTVVSPVASDLDITLVRGDAYTARLGRALTFLDTDDTWPDLTDGVVTLEVGDGELTVTGIVVTATGTGKSVRVEPLSSQTEELTEERYDYNLVVTFPGTGTTLTDGGDRMTLASGTMHVVDREDA